MELGSKTASSLPLGEDSLSDASSRESSTAMVVPMVSMLTLLRELDEALACVGA